MLIFGAEDEIRTRATVSHTTPLAGEPLEPLGYFCNDCVRIYNSLKCYNTITHFWGLVKRFLVGKHKNIAFFLFVGKIVVQPLRKSKKYATIVQ